MTYRSRDSFESRFGRRSGRTNLREELGVMTPPQSPKLETLEDAFMLHNDGHKKTREQCPQIFSAQSYLRYQGDKFTARFDANCYIHITRKLDTHDIARGRVMPSDSALAEVLSTLPPALVISIATDGLFTTSEQRIISQHIPQSELVLIPSEDGHDGFLLEFERINECVLNFLKREFSEYYEMADEEVKGDFEIKKTSVFGEAEVDVAKW